MEQEYLGYIIQINSEHSYVIFKKTESGGRYRMTVEKGFEDIDETLTHSKATIDGYVAKDMGLA